MTLRRRTGLPDMNKCSCFLPGAPISLSLNSIIIAYDWQSHTDKKENQISLLSKEIQNGAVASSYMIKYLRISSYIRKPFLIYDFATAPF
jgi:hypothetical protein